MVSKIAYGTQRGYFEVLAPAPGGSLFYQDREVILQNVSKRTSEAGKEPRSRFWPRELTSTPNDQFLSGDLPRTSSVAGMST